MPSHNPEAERLLQQLTAPRRPDEARAHHTISDFYLKRFADEDERLAVVDLSRASTPRSIRKTRNVAVANDFYTFTDTNGTRNPAVERLLGHIEGQAAAAMRKLSAGIFFPPPRQDREDLSLWMAFQLVRGPEKRREIEAITDVTAKLLMQGIATPDQARARLQRAGVDEPTEAEINDLIHFSSNLDRFDIVPDPNSHIQLMLDLAVNEIAPRIHAMRWAVAKFDEPALLSGDHPITFQVRPEHRSQFQGVGLETADEVRCPIDPSTMLLMTWDRIDEVVGRLPIAAAREFNQHTVDHAFEFVFMHPQQNHLSGLDLGTRPRAVLQVGGATTGASSDGVNSSPRRLRPQRPRRR
jgi:hypothetical protein